VVNHDSLGQGQVEVPASWHNQEDNMDVRPLQEFNDKAAARFRKYLAAYRFLTGRS
jgi:hypothetical protein